MSETKPIKRNQKKNEDFESGRKKSKGTDVVKAEVKSWKRLKWFFRNKEIIIKP